MKGFLNNRLMKLVLVSFLVLLISLEPLILSPSQIGEAQPYYTRNPNNSANEEFQSQFSSHDIAIEENQPNFLSDQLIVKLRKEALQNHGDFGQVALKFHLPIPNDATCEPLEAEKMDLGFQEVLQKGLNRIYRVVLPEGTAVMAIVDALRRSPLVEYAEPVYTYHIAIVPNDPFYHSKGSWGQWFDDLYGLKLLECEKAWDVTQGEGTLVAVIDTGVDINHEDLSANIWINPGEIPNNGLDDDRNGFVDDVNGWNFVANNASPVDDYGHGTHCAGIIAAVGNNGLGIIGVAPKAKILPIKGLSSNGTGNSFDLARAIVYAANMGANILNLSWGGSPSQLIEDAVAFAQTKGCVIVAAAGNSNCDKTTFCPANINGVIAVAATDQVDQKACFSNYGPAISIAAPGMDILSCRAQGTDMYGDGYHIVAEKYYRASGTSMSSPYVAGVCALLRSAHWNWSSAQIRNAIESSADPFGKISQPPDQLLGAGRINAFKAVSSTHAVDGEARITLPYDSCARYSDAFMMNDILIIGTATANGFVSYDLSWGAGVYPSNWISLSESAVPVSNDQLGVISPTSIPNGIICVRLQLKDGEGSTAEDRTIFRFYLGEITYPRGYDIIKAGRVIPIKGSVSPKINDYNLEYSKGLDSVDWRNDSIQLTKATGTDTIIAYWDTSFIKEADYYSLRLTQIFDGKVREYIQPNIWIDPNLEYGEWQPFLGGGRMRSILIAPSNEDCLYVGTWGGKIYKTEDGGENWTGIVIPYPGGGTSECLAIDPKDPLKILVGHPHGIAKSTDGGKTWTYPYVVDNIDFHSLAIDPVQPNIAYAGWKYGVLKSIDGGDNWYSTDLHIETLCLLVNTLNPSILYAGTEMGLYQSSDRGEHWRRIDQGLLRVDCLAMHPQNPLVLYAGSGGLYKSTDGGITWNPLCSMPAVSLRVDPLNPQNIYAGLKEGGMLKSEDGGLSWRQVGRPFVNVNVFGTEVSKTYPDKVFAATDGYGVFRSLDGGAGWKAINRGIDALPIFDFAISPSNPDVQYALSDAALYYSLDRGFSWRPLPVPVMNPWFWSFALNPQNPETIYLGTSIGVYKSTNGGLDWLRVLSDLWIEHIVIDPNDPQTVYAGTHKGVFKTSDGGDHWSPVNNGIPENCNITVQSLAINPRDSRIIFAGIFDIGVYRSQNGGLSWEQVNSGLDYLLVTAITCDPNDPNIVYLGTYGTGVFRSNDGGTTWKKISTNLSWEYQYINAIGVDPSDSNHLVVSTSNGAVETNDGGITWSAIPGCSSDMNRVEFYPPNSSIITSATSGGSYLLASGKEPLITAKVSGRIENGLNGAPLVGVNVFFSGLGVCTTNNAGNYEMKVPIGWNGRVILQIPDATSNPPYRDYEEIKTSLVSQNFTVFFSSQPSLSFTPSSLTFTATQGGVNPPPQTLEVWNSGGGSMNWTAFEDASWLTLSPTSGSSSGEHDQITVSVNISGLSSGTYSATITLTGEGTSNSPQYIPVNLQVNPPLVLNSLSLTPSSWTFTSSTPKQFQATAYFSDGSSQDVTSSSSWSLDNPSVATVNSSGLVTPISNGSTYIRASYSYNGVTKTAQSSVTVNFPHTISITSGPTASPSTIPSGGSTNLSVSASDSLGHSLTYSWSVFSSSIGSGSFSNPNVQNPTWTAPQNLTGVNQTVTLKVRASCSLDPTKYAEGTVSVTVLPQPSLSLTSPNGGETWTIGGTKNITWTSSNLSGNLKIELNRDYPSGSWETIFSSTPNDGSESWVVTGPASSNCRIKISSLNDPSVYDISDGDFSIIPPPSLSFSPTSLTFTATQGGANPPPQTLEVWNSGGGSMNWTASENSSWLSLSPTSGNSSGEHNLITVSVDISSLSPGTYTATITLSGEGASNSPQYIPVTLQVNPPPNIEIQSLTATPSLDIATFNPVLLQATSPAPGNWSVRVFNPLGIEVTSYGSLVFHTNNPTTNFSCSWTPTLSYQIPGNHYALISLSDGILTRSATVYFSLYNFPVKITEVKFFNALWQEITNPKANQPFYVQVTIANWSPYGPLIPKAFIPIQITGSGFSTIGITFSLNLAPGGTAGGGAQFKLSAGNYDLMIFVWDDAGGAPITLPFRLSLQVLP